MTVDELAVDQHVVDVEERLAQVRRLCSFSPTTATVEDLDAIASDITAVAGWMASLRSACAGRRAVLADEASDAGRPSPDRGDPEGGHGKNHRRSRRASAKDLERDQTMRAIPALRDALSAGTIDVEHIDIVTSVLRDLTVPQQVTVRGHGGAIVALAVAHGPDRFRTVLRQLLFRLIEEDGVRRFERQRTNTRLSMWTDRDSGMVKLFGEFDPERGAIIMTRLQQALDALYAQPTPPGCPQDPIAKNNHLRAVALLQLLQTGGLTVGDGGPDVANIDLVVIVDHDTLRHGIHDCSIIDAGDGIDLPVETLRRMACCANIIPAVLGSDGVLLDQGREARLANRRQRRALRAMYPTCAIAGCHTRFDHCKIHHILWWDRDRGPTDLSNLLPLCSRHHHAVHEGGWQLTMDPTSRMLTVRFPDGTTTTMPPPRKGWNGNGEEQPGGSGDPDGRDGSGRAPRNGSTLDATVTAKAGSAEATSTGETGRAGGPTRPRPHPEPEPEPPPELTLWAS